MKTYNCEFYYDQGKFEKDNIEIKSPTGKRLSIWYHKPRFNAKLNAKLNAELIAKDELKVFDEMDNKMQKILESYRVLNNTLFAFCKWHKIELTQEEMRVFKKIYDFK